MRKIISIIWITLLLSSCWNFNLDVSFDDEIDTSNLIEITNTDYIWLSRSEAEELAKDNGVSFRVIEIDWQPQPATKDYRPGRINAVMSDDVITWYTVEGETEK